MVVIVSLFVGVVTWLILDFGIKPVAFSFPRQASHGSQPTEKAIKKEWQRVNIILSFKCYCLTTWQQTVSLILPKRAHSRKF